MTQGSCCRKCGAVLPAVEGKGRPPSYCSTGCRRAAEFEVRRANAAVDRVERDIRAHEEHLAIESPYPMGCCNRDKVQTHLEWLRGEQERLEGRMAALLEEAPQ